MTDHTPDTTTFAATIRAGAPGRTDHCAAPGAPVTSPRSEHDFARAIRAGAPGRH